MKKNFVTKMIAVLSASIIAVSGCSVAFADTDWHSIEKGNLDKASSWIEDNWDDTISEYQTAASESGKIEATVTFGETAKMLVGTLLEMDDVSWLDTISLVMNSAMENDIAATVGDLLVNGTEIIGFETYTDSANLVQYLGLTDIAEGYLKMPIETESSDSDGSAAASVNYAEFYADLEKYAPDAETAKTLLNRYVEPIIDAFDESETSDNTLSVGDVSEDATIYEGTLTSMQLATVMYQTLETAREDEDIKALFDQWGSDQYEDFQSWIDETLGGYTSEDIAATAEQATDDEVAFTSQIAVDADGHIIGRSFVVPDSLDFTYIAPSSDGQNGLYIEFSADDEDIILQGTGSTTDGAQTGEYTLTYNDEEQIIISAENLTAKDGVLHLTFPVQESSDSEDSEDIDIVGSMIAGMGLDVSYAVADDTVHVDVALVASEENVLSLSFDISPSEEDVEIPDLDSLDPVFSYENEGEMSSYFENANWSSISDNLKTAGVPESLVDSLTQLIEESAEEAVAQDSEETSIDEEENSETLSEDIGAATTAE